MNPTADDTQLSTFDVQKIRADFPTLMTKVGGRPLVYFDNGATAQKPASVIKRVEDYYRNENANIHRGVHTLSQEATNEYEEARKKIASWIGAPKSEQVIFTKGTTDAINLVANGFAQEFLKQGDEVIISTMEHHSNIVPWQMACERSGATLKVIKISDSGELDMDHFRELLGEKTRIISLVHVSNTLGTINPVKEVIDLAHQQGVPVLLDGAQAVPHMMVDVVDLDCEFYVFSGHKMFAPTGTGVLYGKEEWLEKLPPYQGGGDMIASVSFEKTTYNELPHKFEAGTPNIAGVIGWGATIDYMQSIPFGAVEAYEHQLCERMQNIIRNIDGGKIIGEAQHKAAVVSFVIEGVHHYDLGTLLDKMGVAVRTGHHCTEPLMKRMNVTGTARASFALYNTLEELDQMEACLSKALNMLR